MKLEDWYKKTERPEERELRRKLRRREIMEFIGGMLTGGLILLLVWLYVIVTLDQSSAINDLTEVQP